MAKPKLLFIARSMPWPLFGGARIRDYNMLQALAASFDVDLLTVGVPEERISALCDEVILPSAHYGDETFVLNAKRWVGAMVETLRHGDPLWLSSKTNTMLRNAIRSCVGSGKYAAVHASELSSVSPLIDQTDVPVVYDAHNCEWRLLARSVEHERFPVKQIIQREVPRLKAVERNAVRWAKRVLVTAEADEVELTELGGEGTAPIDIVRSAIDVSLYEPARAVTPEPGTVLLPGKYDWRPNLHGLDWFLDEVMPRLIDQMGTNPLNVVVAGRMSEATAARIDAMDHASASPNPDSMVPLFGAASAVAVPVLFSSGTRLRIAEAMASGRAIVTTTAGAAGLEGRNGEDWFRADGAEDFADALAKVLTDGALQAKLADGALAFAQTLDWHTLVAPLEQIYTEAAGRS